LARSKEIGLFLARGKARQSGGHEPKKASRNRNKRLRSLRKPQYRLRVGEVRVFYEIADATVEVLAIVAKLEADA
jgi:mRNA interferase RelE/StbE